MNRSRGLWIALALATLPAWLTLAVILRFGVDLPLMDQWMPDIGGMFIKAHHGQLALTDFFAQHNEHRVPIARAIIFVLGLITGWNQIAEMVVQWLLACITSSMILLLCLRTAPARPIFTWFLCNALIFSFGQWEGWLCGLGLANQLPMLFISASIVVASSGLTDRLKIALAIGCATAATYSSSNGMLVWPLAGAVLAWSPSWQQLRSRQWILLAWGVAFAINCGLYFIGYQFPPPAADELSLPAGFSEITHYILAFSGNTFWWGNGLEPLKAATTSGLILLTLYLAAVGYFLYLWRRDPHGSACPRMLIWLAIGAFSIFSAIAASVFRARFGVEQAVSSRYVTFSLYLPVALINLIPIIAADLSPRLARLWGETAAAISRAPVVVATIVVLFFAMSLPIGFATMRSVSQKRLRGKAATLLINVMREDSILKQEVTFDPATLAPVASELSALGYLWPPLITSGNANLLQADPANPGDISCGKIEDFWLSAPGEITVAGWAFQPGTSAPVDAVFLTCDNDKGEPIIFALATEKVRSTGDAARDHLRWAAIFKTDRFPPGLPQLKIRAWQFDVSTARAIRLGEEITFAEAPHGSRPP